MKKLFAHNHSQVQHQIEYEFDQSEFGLKISFKVSKNHKNKWNVNEDFSKSDFRKNDHLWDYDVFEVFVQARPGEKSLNRPYLEIQVSPEEQALALWIIEPRKIAATPLESQFSYSMKTTEKEWTGEVVIPLKNDFFQGEEFYAGIFACLGKDKEYYCHHQVSMEKIDFHRPDLFFRI